MALYVTFVNGQFDYWHVSSKPKQYEDVDIEATESIQADGHELEAIINKCVHLPYVKARVVRWCGDHARFIAANLYYIL